MESENFIPLLTLGLLKDPEGSDDTCYPGAQTYSSIKQINISPEALAGFLVCAFESFINTVPENKQLEIEKKALRVFSKKVKIREEIMEDFKNEEY